MCSRFNNVNYGTWYVYKPLFDFFTTCRLACSEISLSIIGIKLKISPGKGRTWYNLADGVTALAHRDYFMENARVRFLFTSCVVSENSLVRCAHSFVF